MIYSDNKDFYPTTREYVVKEFGEDAMKVKLLEAGES